MLHQPYDLPVCGPPGSGKSTQPKLLARRVPLTAISTGKMLRKEVATGIDLVLRVPDDVARRIAMAISDQK